ncbi:MAG: RluA family pseudouridine synthase [Pirellulales bacterium]
MNNSDLEPPFQILYEKRACLCVVKPGGLLTQAPPHIDSLDSQIKQFVKTRDEKPGRIYLGVPHRLDRPVTGTMVFCRNVRAARRLSAQFRERTVTKIYWAFVAGHPDSEAGTWTDTIRKIPDVAQAEIAEADDPLSRETILHYQVLAKTEHGSLLEIQLETGRYHQIRIQCSSRGFPILGDLQYGSEVLFGPVTENLRERHIALHSRYLKFRHPMIGETVEVTADLTKHWSDILDWNPDWDLISGSVGNA